MNRHMMTTRITTATFEMAKALKVCCHRRDFEFEIREDQEEPFWEISFDYRDLPKFAQVLRAMEVLGYDDNLTDFLYFMMLDSAMKVFGNDTVADLF